MSGGFPLLIFTEGFGLRRGCVWLSSTWGSDRVSGWRGPTLLLCGYARARTHTVCAPPPAQLYLLQLFCERDPKGRCSLLSALLSNPG